MFNTASIVPYKAFRTQDGSILIGGGNDKLYTTMCHLLSRPELATHPSYSTNAQRVANRTTLEPLIESITMTRTTADWLQVFEGSGMPYAAVNDIQDTLNHEHVRARDMVVEMDHEFCGKLSMVNTPVKYSVTKPKIRSAPPILGQHTDEVLREVLGLGESEIQGLRAEGAIR